MSMVTDEETIKPEDLKRLMVLKGERLIDIIHEDLDLIFLFETHKVVMSRQYSEDYGDNIFWDLEILKNKYIKKFVAVRGYEYYKKIPHGMRKVKVRAHLRHNKNAKN